jgi:ribokinase
VPSKAKPLADNRVQRVAVLGSLNMDMVVEVGRLPVPGETVLGGTFRTAGGGKGANQAVAAARVGAQVSLIGCVGEDDHGQRLLALLRDDGVDLRGIRCVLEPTGVAVILVERGGQNLIAVASGANERLSPADVTTAQPIVAAADVLVAQLEVPLPTVTAAALGARGAHVPVILNAAPAQSGLQDLLPLVDVLIVNETELSMLVGEATATGQATAAGESTPSGPAPATDQAAPPGQVTATSQARAAGETSSAAQAIPQGDEASAARSLLDRGPRAVVVTLGPRGALVVDAHGTTAIPAFPVDAVDATAAGDAFVGALAARYRGPHTLLAAARYASAAAALACTRPGAQPSLPWAPEIERLLAYR